MCQRISVKQRGSHKITVSSTKPELHQTEKIPNYWILLICGDMDLILHFILLSGRKIITGKIQRISLVQPCNIYNLKYPETVINNSIRTFPCIQCAVMKETKHTGLLPMRTIIMMLIFTFL